MSASVLMLFSKEPVKGKVKTRLIPDLGEEGAFELYQKLLAKTLTTSSAYLDASTETTGQVWLVKGATVAFKHQIEKDYALSCYVQQGPGLGESLTHAFEESSKSFFKIVVIGGDCVSIDQPYLAQAFECLDAHEAVIGPAEDGGFVLLGLRSNLEYANIFKGIPWGGPEVCQCLEVNLREEGVGYDRLSQRWDIDEPEDLIKLALIPELKWSNP